MLLNASPYSRNADSKTVDSSSACSGPSVPADGQAEVSRLEPGAKAPTEKDLIIARLKQEIARLKGESGAPDAPRSAPSSGS